jgi:hypothetical protein
MNATTALRPTARAGFSELIDYAGLFPPAALGLDHAFEEYQAARRGPHAWMLGRFIVPAGRIPELGDRAKAVPLCVTAVPEDLEEIAALRASGVRTWAIEIKLTSGSAPEDAIAHLAQGVQRYGLRDVRVFAELARDDRWPAALPAAMAAAAEHGVGMKLRCGGLQPSDFPSVEQVTAFVAGAAERGVAFKATAGLHHPIRHFDAPTGAHMHGFLNLLAASALAGRVPLEALRRVVSEEDPDAFALDDACLQWRGERIALDELRSARERRFVAYGSCSFSEPVGDLIALGMLPAA